ncbi:MAG: hypothetical protein JXA25_17180 [Anaerolineales bacterium]|nr:hypothetical protein [Anaerolineales bacterium]
MSENRCPMCSKTNSPEAEVCQHCGARLKPLFIGSPDEDSKANRSTGSFSPQPLDSDSDQFLRESFSAGQSLYDGDTDADEGPEPGNAQDGWLERFRSEAIPVDSPEEIGAADFPDSTEESPSDAEPWMDSFRSNLLGGEMDLDQVEDVESGAEEAVVEPDTDWLSRFRSGVIPDSTENLDLHTADTSRLEPRSVEEEFPERVDSTGFREAPGEQETFELPNWPEPSSKPEEKSWPQQPAADESDGVPDWLSGLKEDEKSLPDEFSAADENGWMEEPPAAESGTVPDWLSGLKEDEKSLPEGLPAAGENGWMEEPPAAESGTVPDWLSGLKEDEKSFPDELPADGENGWMEEPAAAEPGIVPDWLSRLKEEDGPIPEELPADGENDWMEEPAAAEPGNVPDWLSGLGEEDELIPEELPTTGENDWMEGPAASEPGNVPDWMSGLGEEDESISAPQATDDGLSEWDVDENLAVPANIPEWLSGFREKEDSASISDEQLWEGELQGPSENDVPDWLSVFSEQEEDQALTDEPSHSASAEIDGERTPPLAAFQEEDIGTESDLDVGSLDAFSAFSNLRPAQEATDTPDWLRDAFDSDTESLLEDEEKSRKQLEGLMEEESDSDGLPEWYAAPRHSPPPPPVDQPVELPLESDVIPQHSEADTEENRAATPRWLQDIVDETRVDVEAELESAIAESIDSAEALEEEDRGVEIEEPSLDQAEWIGEPLPASLYDDDKELDLTLSDADLPSWLQDARTSQGAETGRLKQEEQEAPEQVMPEIDFSAIEEEEEVLPDLELKEYEPGKSLFDEFQEIEKEEPSWAESAEDELDQEETPLVEPEESLDSAEMPEWLSQVHARQTKETTMLSWEPQEEHEPSLEDQDADGQQPGLEGKTDGEYSSPEEDIPFKSAVPWLDDLSIELSEDLADDLDSELQSGGLLGRGLAPQKENEVESFDFTFRSDNTSEWMADLSEEQDSAQVEGTESVPFSLSGPESLRPFSLKDEAEHVEQDLDWLDELPAEEAAAPEPEVEGGQDIQDAEMPDWLSQIRKRQSGKTAFLQPPEEMDAWETPEDLDGEIEKDGLSEWPPRRIDEEEQKELEQALHADPERFTGYEELEEEHPGTKPVWLEDLPDSPISPPSAPAFISGALSGEEVKGIEDYDLSQERQSEWLEDIKPGGAKPEIKGADRINISRATLPAWLEAMRPVEALAGESDRAGLEQEAVETVGPLAGISGALSAEPAVASQHKMRSGSSVLNISDGEYERADLLSKLLADEETELKPIPRHTGSQKRLRWIVSVVLILASLIPSLFGFPAFSLPIQEPLDLDTLFSIVNQIQEDKPALVVYDVEPGYSAEMEAVAGPLFYHLLGRQIPVITVSTEITGPALVDRIFRNISLPFFPENGQDYLHLGYLSGGASGIQQFTRNPAHAGLDGYLIPEGFLESDDSIWGTPILSGISSLDHFSMVSVVVNDSDRARMWIEQAGPVLGNTPLVMVVSTGLEPAIRPYYEDRDPLVDGLLAGVPAAAAYDLRFQRTGNAALLWNPYNTTLTMAFIGLAGAMSMGLYGWIKDRRQRAENEVS